MSLCAGESLAATEISPVGVGAGVLAGPMPVVQQALVLVRAERALEYNSTDIYNLYKSGKLLRKLQYYKAGLSLRQTLGLEDDELGSSLG